jgi:hypothetical protein
MTATVATIVWWLVLVSPNSQLTGGAGIYKTEEDCKWAGEAFKRKITLVLDYKCEAKEF